MRGGWLAGGLGCLALGARPWGALPGSGCWSAGWLVLCASSRQPCCALTGALSLPLPPACPPRRSAAAIAELVSTPQFRHQLDLFSHGEWAGRAAGAGTRGLRGTSRCRQLLGDAARLDVWRLLMLSSAAATPQRPFGVVPLVFSPVPSAPAPPHHAHAALMTGQLDTSQFGLPPGGYGVRDFLKAIQAAADTEAAAKSSAAQPQPAAGEGQ